MKSNIYTVLAEVKVEREDQDSKFGLNIGYENPDDNLTALDWHEMISDYNGWARRMLCVGNVDKARRRYIQIAALAVAAVESLDRKLQNER